MPEIQHINNDKHLIAIGGTGQNIAISYLRLAKIAGFKPADIWLIDSDVDGEITKTLTRAATKVSGNVRMIKPTTMLQHNATKFRDVLSDTDENVVNALFSRELLETDISAGMYCRPIIGSTAIQLKIQKVIDRDEDELRNDQEFALLLNIISQNNGNKIAITGSNFGGTGAGCLPVLSEYISRSTRQTGNSNVSSLIMLPWFNLSSRTNNYLDETSGADQSHMFKNASTGTSYLIERMKSIGPVMLMQTPGIAANVEYTGNSKQGECKHAIYMLAAMNMQNMLNSEAELQRGTFYSYAIPDNGLTPKDFSINKRQNGTVAPMQFSNSVRNLIIYSNFLTELKFFLSQNRITIFGPMINKKFLDFINHLSTRDNIRRQDIRQRMAEMITEEIEYNNECLAWLDEISGGANGQNLIFTFNRENLGETGFNEYAQTTPAIYFNRWLLNDRTLDYAGWKAGATLEEIVRGMLTSLRRYISRGDI